MHKILGKRRYSGNICAEYALKCKFELAMPGFCNILQATRKFAIKTIRREETP